MVLIRSDHRLTARRQLAAAAPWPRRATVALPPAPSVEPGSQQMRPATCTSVRESPEEVVVRQDYPARRPVVVHRWMGLLHAWMLAFCLAWYFPPWLWKRRVPLRLCGRRSYRLSSEWPLLALAPGAMDAGRSTPYAPWPDPASELLEPR